MVRWITSKEIDIRSLPQKKLECIELLCLMERELPTSFFDIQVHVLIHLIEEIELAGVVSTRWMFWVERYMGVLKGFVHQRARPEGSMAEGWLHHECMYYLSKYLQRLDDEAPCAWTADQSSTLTEEVISGKGAPLRLSIEERESLSTFVLYNSECMQKWIDKHDKEWLQKRQGRAKRRKVSGTPTMSLQWIQEQLKKATQEGEEVTREELELGLGCDREVVNKSDPFVVNRSCLFLNNV